MTSGCAAACRSAGGTTARSEADRALRRQRFRRRRSERDGPWADTGDSQSARARELRVEDLDLVEINEPCSASDCVHPRVSGSIRRRRTSTAVRSRSAIRWGPAARALPPRCCTNCAGAAAGTGWPRCASAWGRGLQRFSSGRGRRRRDDDCYDGDHATADRRRMARRVRRRNLYGQESRDGR